MAHRIYLAVELTREEGRGLDPDTLAEILEAELPDYLDEGESYYAMAVLGVGSTIENLRESMRLRRDNARSMAAAQNGGSA